MDRVVDYCFVLDGSGKVMSFPGSYTEYLDFKKQRADEPAAKNTAAQKKEEPVRAARPAKEKTKLSFNEQREYQTIEADIQKLEAERDQTLSLINGGSSDPALYAQWGDRFNELEKIINEKYARWEYFESFSPPTSGS
jgi:ATP-binding cassette subfamily F protein uup